MTIIDLGIICSKYLLEYQSTLFRIFRRLQTTDKFNSRIGHLSNSYLNIGNQITIIVEMLRIIKIKYFFKNIVSYTLTNTDVFCWAF